jgi:hypothetical protein
MPELTEFQKAANARLAVRLRGLDRDAQGFHTLRTDETADMTQGCCLGWACDVYHEDTGRGHWERRSNSWYFVLDGNVCSNLPPGEVAEYFGWGDVNPTLKKIKNNQPDWDQSAAVANDSGNYSLAEIGAAFERTFVSS